MQISNEDKVTQALTNLILKSLDDVCAKSIINAVFVQFDEKIHQIPRLNSPEEIVNYIRTLESKGVTGLDCGFTYFVVNDMSKLKEQCDKLGVLYDNSMRGNKYGVKADMGTIFYNLMSVLPQPAPRMLALLTGLVGVQSITIKGIVAKEIVRYLFSNKLGLDVSVRSVLD